MFSRTWPLSRVDAQLEYYTNHGSRRVMSPPSTDAKLSLHVTRLSCACNMIWRVYQSLIAFRSELEMCGCLTCQCTPRAWLRRPSNRVGFTWALPRSDSTMTTVIKRCWGISKEASSIGPATSKGSWFRWQQSSSRRPPSSWPPPSEFRGLNAQSRVGLACRLQRFSFPIGCCAPTCAAEMLFVRSMSHLDRKSVV